MGIATPITVERTTVGCAAAEKPQRAASNQNMKRAFLGLGIGLVCGVMVLGSLVSSFPSAFAGCLGPSSPAVCHGSGVYIGDGLMLTNQHVASALSEQSSFRVPAWKHLWRTVDAGFGRVVFLNRDMELGIVHLRPSVLNLVGMFNKPCLASRPVTEGEALSVTSSVRGRFPPVSAALIVSDARPMMRLDPSPRGEDPYSAITIIAKVSADQATLVGPGSSGGPVFNNEGELVGLVWTGRALADGSVEVWITPASAWFDRHEDGLGAIREARCSS